MTKKKRLRKLAAQARKSESAMEPRKAPIQITLTEEGMLIESGTGFRFVTLGGIKIARPRVFHEAKNRENAKAHLRSKFASGTYRKGEDINEILKYQVAYFESQVDQALRRLASQDCLHFLFDQYDKARKIEDLFRAGTLSTEDAEQWTSHFAYTRRAYKFLCERIVLLNPQPDKDGEADVSELPYLYDEAIICAEQLLAFSMHSDQTRYLFPDESVFTILPEGQDIVGGAALSMLTDFPGAGDVRPTDDVDIIIDTPSYAQYSTTMDWLRKEHDFRHDLNGPLDRFIVRGVTVDVMPTEESVLKFANKWYCRPAWPCV